MSKRPRRGFSLLELVVASVMVLAITATSLAIMLTVYFTQIESQIRNATTRDCQLVLDTIGEDLRYLGVGVPYGANVQTAIGATGDPTIQLRPALRVAESQYIAFIGDLPYPNADFNGLAIVSDIQGTSPTDTDDELAISSELSGCVPPESGGSGVACDTRAMSPAWGGAGPVACSSTATGAVTCPWALNKWQRASTSSVDLVIGAPTGVWALSSWDMGDFSTDKGQLVIHMNHGYPPSGHNLRRAPFVDSRAGASMIAQLDRVFYSLEQSGSTTPCGATQDCVLKRRQCWGPLGSPAFANFPAAGTTSAAVGYSGGNPGNCGAGAATSNGTRWEPVTGAIEALSFRYFDEDNVEIATPIATRANLARVASIEVEVAVRRRVRAAMMPNFVKSVTQRMTRRYSLANNGPWVDSFACAGAAPPATANCDFRGNP